MAVPLSYNLRNLKVRITTTVMTSLGIALTVAVLLGIFAWASFEFVRYEYEDQAIAFASVPAWVCEAVMPFGAAVMCLRYIGHVFNPPVREEA